MGDMLSTISLFNISLTGQIIGGIVFVLLLAIFLAKAYR